MRLSPRRSGFAWIVLLSLLGAALVAPVIEVGDLLETSLGPSCPRPGASDAPPVARRGSFGSLASNGHDEVFVVGQYVAVGADRTLRPVLEPVARLVEPRLAPLSLARAGRLDLDRGPPQSL